MPLLDTEQRAHLGIDRSIVATNFGKDAKVHLDLGSVGIPMSVEQFLEGRGKPLGGFTGKLQLASAEQVGAAWSYTGTTEATPAKGLFVLVETTDQT